MLTINLICEYENGEGDCYRCRAWQDRIYYVEYEVMEKEFHVDLCEECFNLFEHISEHGSKNIE